MKTFLLQNRNPFLLLIIIGGYVLLYLKQVPVFGEEHSTWCLFHLFSGLPCPACGTGRGLICLLHGKFYDALLFNPLSYLAAMMGILSFVMLLKDWLQKTDKFRNMMRVRISSAFQIPFWALLLANEIWNIYKGV
ncbi:MAG: DUF2752 domain-containing protein [Chitinophagales bacterium]